MKRLHRKDLFCWSVFEERLDIDFNGFAWIREGGNVVIDPVALSWHDAEQLRSMGGVAWIVITNSMHVRAAEKVKAAFGSKIAGPAAERNAFPIPCDRWLADGDELVPGLRALELHGSKTPGELALVLAGERTSREASGSGETIICGDLVRSHRAGSLTLLRPEQKLRDPALARESVRRLAALPCEAVMVGDGFSVYRDGQRALTELLSELEAAR